MAEQPTGVEDVNDGSSCQIWGVGGAGTEEDHQGAPREPVLDGQALITAPSGLSEATVVNMQRCLVSSPQSRPEVYPTYWGAQKRWSHTWPKRERFDKPRRHAGLYAGRSNV